MKCLTSDDMDRMVAENKLRSRYRDACVRAIESAAAKLGMDPAGLAENCANGEIGTLVEAASNYMNTPDHASAEKSLDTYESLLDSLKPFTKE